MVSFLKYMILSAVLHPTQAISTEKLATIPTTSSWPSTIAALNDLCIGDLFSAGIRGLIWMVSSADAETTIDPHTEAWIQAAKARGLSLFVVVPQADNVTDWSNRLNVDAIAALHTFLPWTLREAIACLELNPWEVMVISNSNYRESLSAWVVGCPRITLQDV